MREVQQTLGICLARIVWYNEKKKITFFDLSLISADTLIILLFSFFPSG